MKLEFNPQTGLIIPSGAEIRAIAAQRMKDAFYEIDAPELNTEPSTPAGQLVDILTAEVLSTYSYLAYYFAQLSPLTSEGVFQDAYASLYSITRQVEQPTLVTCQLTGVPGTIVPYGSQAKTEGGIFLLNTGDVTIRADGKATAIFRVVEPGPIVVPAHSVKQVVTIVAGWDTIDNENAGVVGRHRETHAELDARRLRAVARNSHGAADSIEGALVSVRNVIDCRVLENTTNTAVTMHGVQVEAHSIAACIYGGDDADIAEAIYNKKDVGCGTSGNTSITHKENGVTQQYKILRPTPTPLKIKVSFKSGTMGGSIQDAIKQAIYDDFYGNGASQEPRVGLARTVYALRFVNAVNTVVASYPLLSVQIGLKSSGLAQSVDIKADQEPTLDISDIEIALGA